MIFVNDIPGIRDIPQWLGHIPTSGDGMFLADVVFPLFLFWVGMSIPLAIDGRQKKGDGEITILKHILKRTAGLVFIGVLMVNTGDLEPAVAGIDRNTWALLMYLGVIAAWRVYGKEKTKTGRLTAQIFHYIGIGLLAFVVLVFRSRNGGWLTPQWWGILGLIGWAYLVSAVAFLFLKKHFNYLMLFFLGLLIYHAAYTQITFLKGNADWLAINSYGAHACLTFAGMMATLVMKKYRHKTRQLFMIWGMAGFIFLVGGFASRSLWGISKIQASPSWVYISLGIGFGLLMLVWFLTEIKARSSWARLFSPAGTQTFLAYLLPGVYYHVIWLFGINYPVWMSQSWGGILRALAFTIITIRLTGILSGFGIRLKL